MLAQWTVYDDSLKQLVRWLTDLETSVQVEGQLQNTMQEKKHQLERVKVDNHLIVFFICSHSCLLKR